MRVPQLDDYLSEGNSEVKSTHGRWALLLYFLAWCCLVTAAARPQWTGDLVELPVSGRDLMLAIDISKSMDHNISHNGFSVSRLTATRAIASEFIERRVGDRIGLILFGDQAYVQAPLTFDRTTVITLLNEAVTGLAGQQTAIGDAIGLAVKRLHAQKENTRKGKAQNDNTGDNTIQNDIALKNDKGVQPDEIAPGSISEERILVLLTDGVNTSGEIAPTKAAELAADIGLKIHTIGIGRRGSRELDERTLRIIANETGGRYFRAYDTSDLREIYRILDELEPVEKDVQSYRPIRSLFYIPLAASLVLATILAAILYLPSPIRLVRDALRTAVSGKQNRQQESAKQRPGS
jgi:Ca-activated chloride channel family protein